MLGPLLRSAPLWGKSAAGDRPLLLAQHLLDAAAVGAMVWDEFVAPGVRRAMDECCGGEGRRFFMWLCAVHDVGKASPSFQAKLGGLSRDLDAAGFSCQGLTSDERGWHHALTGAVILKQALAAANWPKGAVMWVWPLIAGHHGRVPGPNEFRSKPGIDKALGDERWREVQEQLLQAVGTVLGFPGCPPPPRDAPRRAQQLALLGALVMADWVASDERHFPGVADPAAVSWVAAQSRAHEAWRKLRLRGGWSPGRLLDGLDAFSRRFGLQPRPLQEIAVEAAEAMAQPGLLVLEAPTGEGKTEAALAAAEVLSRKFGLKGLFVGMPTQATADSMYARVRAWARQVDEEAPLALLHGKRQFNRDWWAVEQAVRFALPDDVDDPYGCSADAGSTPSRSGPSEWFLGRKRGLLTPLGVGTVDQLLLAATRTRHVMLRHAGLAGHVVVLDEVHAYDAYMSQFLNEALRWLADAGVPVILLSATLPPAILEGLLTNYLQGALGIAHRDKARGFAAPAAGGYPRVLSIWLDGCLPRLESRDCPPWRSPVHVRVGLLQDGEDEDGAAVVELLGERLREGGCALVIRNTVARAQRTYLAVREAFPGETVLLHGRLAVGDRADLTERLLAELGPPGSGERPRRRIVVATQVAEQSFDIDADLLISDLAPMDLLLQRAGRLHRHERPEEQRPRRLREPWLFVSGMVASSAGDPPRFPRGSERVYGRAPLLRAAALVLRAVSEGGWSLPADVPRLVAAAYDDAPDVPAAWAEAAGEAEREWEAALESRQQRARQFLLRWLQPMAATTLAGLHDNAVADLEDEDIVAGVVRDGEPSVEVVLVRHDGERYRTLLGRSLGVSGEGVSDPDLLEEVLRSTVRLPVQLTEAARRDLRPLPGWDRHDPWLGRVRALVVDREGCARLAGWKLTYDRELGLVESREGAE